MFQAKKACMNSHERPMCVQGTQGSSLPPILSPASAGPSSSMIASSTPSTSLEAPIVSPSSTQLISSRIQSPVRRSDIFSNLAEATPKTIMRVMGVKGLTLYHLKSHLQKFRLGKQPHKELNDHNSAKDAGGRGNAASSSGIMGRATNENYHITEALRMQMEVQRRLHEQLEVQKHLQMRIEAQGKYMQTILEKACQTLAKENTAAGGAEMCFLKDMGSPLGFPSLHDLHLYAGGVHHLVDESSRGTDTHGLDDIEHW